MYQGYRVLSFLVFFFFYSCCSHLEHRASVKRFISLQFLDLRHTVELFGRVISPSQGRYLTQTQNKHEQTSMLRVGFESTIQMFEWAKTVHALDRAATVMGAWNIGHPWNASFHFSRSVGLLRRRISLSQGRYLTQTQNKHRHPCLQVGFEPAIPEFERAKTVHALDRAATVMTVFWLRSRK
jgi:hypothetical protein